MHQIIMQDNSYLGCFPPVIQALADSIHDALILLTFKIRSYYFHSRMAIRSVSVASSYIVLGTCRHQGR